MMVLKCILKVKVGQYPTGISVTGCWSIVVWDSFVKTSFFCCNRAAVLTPFEVSCGTGGMSS